MSKVLPKAIFELNRARCTTQLYLWLGLAHVEPHYKLHSTLHTPHTSCALCSAKATHTTQSTTHTTHTPHTTYIVRTVLSEGDQQYTIHNPQHTHHTPHTTYHTHHVHRVRCVQRRRPAAEPPPCALVQCAALRPCPSAAAPGLTTGPGHGPAPVHWHPPRTPAARTQRKGSAGGMKKENQK